MLSRGHVHPRTWVGGGARRASGGRGRRERSERSSSGEYLLRKAWCNIGRDRIHVSAEHHLGGAPLQEEVQGAVAHFHGLHHLGLQLRQKPLSHLPLLAGSGIDAQQFFEESPVHLPSQPLARSTWAICTALVAAPLRILSLTHHRLRPLSTEGSRRMRPTKTSSLSQALMGMG